MGNKKIINIWIVLVLILTSHFGWSQAAIIKTPELNNYEIKFEKEKMASMLWRSTGLKCLS